MEQIKASYSFKWKRVPRWGFDRDRVRDFNNRWFHEKVGCNNEEACRVFVRGKKAILDVGTGLGGKVAYLCQLNPNASVIGADYSASVEPAFRNVAPWPNAHIVQADLWKLPFAHDTFDLIISDGVLHHTPDPRKAFRALVPYLAHGGEIAIYVYKRLGPIREFCDDLLRRATTRLSPEACWEFSKPFTQFGRALSELQCTIEIPEDLPVLGIKAGRYDLQRFIYHHMVKCFWNPDFSFEENTLVNFDWYHPVYASHHTEEEVIGWFKEAGLTKIRSPRTNANGISVIGRRR